MKLNHLDLQVSDVGQSVAFLETYCDLALCSNRDSPALAIMSDREGFTLVLQRRKPGSDDYPAGFHFGFLVDDAALVHAFRARVSAAGIEISDVIHNGRGTLVYCRPPGMPLLEVSCRK